MCVCVCVCAVPSPINVTRISYGRIPHEYALALPGGSVILEAGEASFNGTAEAGVVHARPCVSLHLLITVSAKPCSGVTCGLLRLFLCVVKVHGAGLSVFVEWAPQEGAVRYNQLIDNMTYMLTSSNQIRYPTPVLTQGSLVLDGKALALDSTGVCSLCPFVAIDMYWRLTCVARPSVCPFGWGRVAS